MVDDPKAFKTAVQSTLVKHAQVINRLHANGMYFFDYGNAFLLEASRAGADVMAANGIDFSYPSYVQDILGPLCFDYGFGPFDGFAPLAIPKIYRPLTPWQKKS